MTSMVRQYMSVMSLAAVIRVALASFIACQIRNQDADFVGETRRSSARNRAGGFFFAGHAQVEHITNRRIDYARLHMLVETRPNPLRDAS